MLKFIQSKPNNDAAQKRCWESSFHQIPFFLSLAVWVLAIGCVEDEGGEVPKYLDVVTQVTSLDFETVTLSEPKVLTYGLYASEIKDGVTAVSTAPFLISKSPTDGFSSEVTFEPGDFENELASVYVRFSASEEGEYTGEIVHSTDGLISEPKVTVTGLGVLDPASLPDLLLRENFDYSEDFLPNTNRATDGTNPTLEGWLKIRAANKDLELIHESLTFSGYPESGIGKAVIIDRNPDVPGIQTNLLQRNIDPQQDAEFVGSYYASFLFKIEDVPAAGGHNSPLIFASWNPNNGASWWSSGFMVQNDKPTDADPDNLLFGIRNESLLQTSSKNAEVGKTYLVVLKHTVTQAIPAEQEMTATSTASVFVFEEGETIDVENEPDALFTMENLPDKFYIRSVTLFQEDDANGRYILDGLRVTNTWEDIFK